MLKTILVAGSLSTAVYASQPADHLVFEPKGTPNGKHIVLIAGDEEYRSEEAMPMMGQVLANNGFKTTVLFSLDKNGKVDPMALKSLSSPEALDSADALVLSIRFRGWDDAAMEKFQAALNRGVGVVGLRTTTHAFKFPKNSKWADFGCARVKGKKGLHGGFGPNILGTHHGGHHGKHNAQGTRTVVEEANKTNPLLNGVDEIFGKTDVYVVEPAEDSTILLRGLVTENFEPDSKAIAGPKNDPPMPVVWSRSVKNDGDKDNKVLTITMGSSQDLADENLRRLVINGTFWGTDLEVPAKADTSIQGEYKPTHYKFKAHRKGALPADFIPQ
jgi:hypothetical protein